MLTTRIHAIRFSVALVVVTTCGYFDPTVLATDGAVPPTRMNGASSAVANQPLDPVEVKQSRQSTTQSSVGVDPAPLATIPPNDDCANASAINGEGMFNFDNAMATMDGPDQSACVDTQVSCLGTLDKDVWYCWTASCTGPVEVQTCGQTSVDTRIAVYDGCACPMADDPDLLRCNDDFGACNLQSSVGFAAVAGQQYLIQLGTYPGNLTCSGGTFQPAPGGTGTFEVSCIAPPCNQPAQQCQDVDITNGNTSDRTNFTAADNFRPAVDGDVSEVCWWGSYSSDTPTIDRFEIRYFNSVNGHPGSVIAGPFSQTGGTLTVTGPVDTAQGVDFPVFQYSATHAPVPVTAGDCYFIEITNSTPESGVWFWHWGFGGDVASRQDGSPLNGYDNSDMFDGNDLAFCLNIERGDPRCCTPPSTPACATSMGDCFTGQSAPGCGDPDCCNLVCACDPFCCNVAWDSDCASDGAVPGCGAAALCQVDCSLCSAAIVSSSPASGSIDARQPHDLNDANIVFGWDVVDVDMPDCAVPTAQTGDFSVTKVGGDGGISLPTITSVVPQDADTVRLTLSKPIEPGAWTVVTHVASGTKTCLGYLPGDVNASRGSTAADINALINSLNNVPGFVRPLFATDANRSGAPNASDILRVIDLLNGAAAFDPWLNKTLPPDPCN